jgi:hypothetical protein
MATESEYLEGDCRCASEGLPAPGYFGSVASVDFDQSRPAAVGGTGGSAAEEMDQIHGSVLHPGLGHRARQSIAHAEAVTGACLSRQTVLKS